jgi:hypothetical protein
MSIMRCPYCRQKLGNYLYADECPHCQEELEHNTTQLSAPGEDSPRAKPSRVPVFGHLLQLIES